MTRGPGQMGAPRQPDRVAVIAGAARGVGGLLATALVDAGLRVVFLGLEDEALLDVAHYAPHRIETLSLARGRATMLTALTDAWAAEPIDLYIDLTAATASAPPRPGEAVSRSAGLSAALRGGLRAGAALCLVLVPEPGGTRRSIRAFLRQLRLDLLPARVMELAVPVPLDALDGGEQQALASDMLCLLETAHGGAETEVTFHWAPDTGLIAADGHPQKRDTNHGDRD